MNKQKTDVAPVAIQTPAVTPMGMIQLAVDKGASIEQLERLMQLQERWEANEARKAYAEALTAFKEEPLIIGKDRHVKYGQTEYNHATLGNVCNIIGAALSKHGLSYRWNTEQVEGKIKVSCILMHVKGHSESISLESAADVSGGKNAIQGIGSAVSYLQRYTLLAITGTATQEQDDDGRKIGDFMDEGRLCDYLAGIEAATDQGGVAKSYLPAISEASELKDQEAMDQLNAAKAKKFIEFKGERK